jgi:hypothetical protein
MTSTTEKLDNLARALKGVSPDRLRTVTTKGSSIVLRVSASEKTKIKQTAERLGITVSEYLLQLHRIAAERLAER